MGISEWHMSQVATQRAVVGNIFSIGACGLIFVALASYFGRLPVTVLFQAIFFATTCWSASATNFKSYLAARIVNGLFCSVGQGGALMWIKDLVCQSSFISPDATFCAAQNLLVEYLTTLRS